MVVIHASDKMIPSYMHVHACAYIIVTMCMHGSNMHGLVL